MLIFVEVLASSEVKARLTGMPKTRCLPVLSPVLHHRLGSGHANNFLSCLLRLSNQAFRGGWERVGFPGPVCSLADQTAPSHGRAGGPSHCPWCCEHEAQLRCVVFLGRQNGPPRGVSARGGYNLAIFLHGIISLGIMGPSVSHL